MARQFRSDRDEVPSRDSLGGGGSYIAGNERREEGEWKWMSAQEATRNELGVADIRRYMGCVLKVQQPSQLQSQQKQESESESESGQQRQPTMKEKLTFESADATTIPLPATNPPSSTSETRHKDSVGKGKGIFTHLTFYINGSTYPTISDHKLKHLLADEGGNISLYLARKSVTHVILGAATATTSSGGRKSGGLLSAGKMQNEVLSKTSGFGKGIKYVNVEWCGFPFPSSFCGKKKVGLLMVLVGGCRVIESIKAGKKLPEARFSPSSSVISSSSSNTRGDGLDRYKTTGNGGGVGVPVGQKSVYDMFNKSTISTTTRSNEDIG